MAVSEENKSIAMYLRSALGGKPSVVKFWDERELKSIDLMSAESVPVEGVVTVATLGLSDHDGDLTSSDIPLRAELVFPISSACRHAPNIVSTCAFTIMDANRTPSPGQVLQGMVEMYEPELDMKHALLTYPFLWDLQAQAFEKKKVAFLQIVPISDAERDYVVSHGLDALEDLFEGEQIDVFNLRRPSVL